VGVSAGPKVESDGLVLALDAANPKNYNLTAVEVLVVAGGGGGGGRSGGGGGAGGLIYNSNFSVTPGSAITVTVGGGGAGGSGSGPPGSDGQNSVFDTLTAIGGGGGGSDGANAGRSGGSGGGGKYGSGGGSGTSGQGFAGGSGTSGTWKAGGGGGAGDVGVNGSANPHKCGDGGPGLGFYISGTFTYYSGGGGGGSHNSGGGCCDDSSARGLGGIGGGGDGGTPGGRNSGTNGTANTGGGGGGGSTTTSSGGAGGNGGSGIVIVRYPGPQKAIGGTVTSVNGYMIHTFTTTGSTTFTPLAATNNSAIFGISDFSGNNRFATSTNGVVYSGDNLGSLSFDGVNDYVDLGSDIIVSPDNQGWTAEYWFNTSSASTLQHFNSSENDEFNANWLAILNSKLAVWNRNPGYWKYGSTTIQSNTWYQAVFVCDSGGTNYRYYINGVREGGNHVDNVWNSTYSSLETRYVGRYEYSGSYSRYFVGKMPIVKMYNKALTASEIQQNFNATRSRFGI